LPFSRSARRVRRTIEILDDEGEALAIEERWK
jgi:hypothetical protein